MSAEFQVSPFQAFKLARVCLVDGELRLAPLHGRPGGRGFYEVFAAAECEKGRVHPVPAWDCECGFHAVGSFESLWRLGWQTFDTAVLEVELSGRVIEHQHGFRAGHQQVRLVRLSSRCHRCGRDAECLGSRSPRSPLGPSCRRCARGVTFSFDRLASDLGCPVVLDVPSGDRAAPVVESWSFAVQAVPPVALAASGSLLAVSTGWSAVASVAGMLAGGWLLPGRLLATRFLAGVELSEPERLRVLTGRGGLVLLSALGSWSAASFLGAALSGVL